MEAFSEPKTRHYVGFPEELGVQGDVQQELPSAQVILLNQSDEGYFLYRYTATGQSGGDTGYFLYRYTATGQSGGDTWHLTLDDALYQAQFEYGDGLMDWYPAPQNADDILTIALNHLAQG